MDTNAVRVRNLHKNYGDARVVDDVSFDIERGETFALLGPNGAGKSTTVEILEGYRRRSGGEVSVLGVDPARGGRDWKARLGIVLQSAGQAGEYTVREQLRQFAGYYPGARDVDEVIAAVGLEAQASTRIAKLSGGQHRRVDVALGIIGSPELLFLDEPTTGFDPHARREFWGLIRGLKHDGVTILLTTHYLDEAAQLADRVAVITDGGLKAIGPVATFGGEDARIPVVRWFEGGEMREVRDARPAQVVREITDRLGAEPEALEVRRPSLEDIYLDLVGEGTASLPLATAPAGADSEGARS
ncbi:ABC transporter ATP-binding protein [Microbacterium sp. LRZ72]|uniref:ABC transporter ATP-binding protein n=1 Tax=Microbacterium sp. LRZ72 TaxID=2942481 RepID=UPI0029B25AD0|nr:ABC transporter ATP-binding protein [Microbacterium sp. LRZ72]MDX2376800.1 ABC transporter ATP-binding protein [Microbacterium sp. LRZ72]